MGKNARRRAGIREKWLMLAYIVAGVVQKSMQGFASYGDGHVVVAARSTRAALEISERLRATISDLRTNPTWAEIAESLAAAIEGYDALLHEQLAHFEARKPAVTDLVPTHGDLTRSDAVNSNFDAALDRARALYESLGGDIHDIVGFGNSVALRFAAERRAAS